MAVVERVLPQHFNPRGEIKRRYSTLADAVYATRLTLVEGDPPTAYPCYCGHFHIGRTRHAVARDEDFIWALETGGWTPRTVTDRWHPDGVVFWSHPELGATKLSLPSAWDQAYALASAEASRRLASRPQILAARAHVRGDETADEKRRILAAAGWRRVNNPTVERWRRPGVTARTRKSSGKSGKPLHVAWLLFLRDTPKDGR